MNTNGVLALFKLLQAIFFVFVCLFLVVILFCFWLPRTLGTTGFPLYYLITYDKATKITQNNVLVILNIMCRYNLIDTMT